MSHPTTDKPYRTGFPPDAPTGSKMTVWLHGKVVGHRMREFPNDYNQLTRWLNEAYREGARAMRQHNP